eukprot:Partr_v1_DN24809_c0_g1_i1_m29906 putative eukaryotic translation initiation factor
MSNLNVRRDVKDPFYRYKMPPIKAKVEGKGNGIKTLIPNIADVAKALHRPPSYPTKYFGCELGAQVKMDEAKSRFIVNGAHEASKLQDTLDGFISRFVLCGDCQSPETDLVVTTQGKDGDIKKQCKACGKVTDVDMRHKLCAYITKNPPTAASGAGARYASGNKKSKGGGGNDSDSNDSQQEDDGAADRLMEGEMKKLAVAAANEKSSLDDWSVDTSAEAIAARQREMAALGDKIDKKLSMADGVAAGEESSLEELARFVEGNPAASASDIHGLISKLDVREDKAVAVLVQVLFTDRVLDQMPAKKSIFAGLMESEKSQKAFLGGLERLVAVAHPELLPKIALVLKCAYDCDMLDEEVILAWGKKPSKKYVSKEVSKEIRKKAEPFLTWLATAEEEDDSDDDSE